MVTSAAVPLGVTTRNGTPTVGLLGLVGCVEVFGGSALVVVLAGFVVVLVDDCVSVVVGTVVEITGGAVDVVVGVADDDQGYEPPTLYERLALVIRWLSGRNGHDVPYAGAASDA